MHHFSSYHSLMRRQQGVIAFPHWFLSWIFPLSVFFIALIIYMRTMCPTIYPGDGAELTAAAWSLGVPHPTGYPLFMVLGFFFQHTGLGSPAFCMNLLTALFGAIACAGIYRLQREIWRVVLGIHKAKLPAFRFAAAGLALALGFSASWWDQSTQAEVYTLMLAFVAFAWTMGLRLIRHPTRNGLMGLALLSGFAMLHHMLFIITFPLSGIALLQWWRKNPESYSRRLATIGIAIALFVIPLSGYLYLPVRAASLPTVNWGNPRGIQGILWHLTGQQYASTKILADPNGEKLTAQEIPEHIQNRLLELGRWMSIQHAPHDVKRPYRGSVLVLVVILLAGLGAFMLWRHSPLAALGLVASLLLNMLLIIIYTIADIHSYQIPLLILLGCLSMTGPVTVAEFFPPKAGETAYSDHRWSRRALIVGVLALALTIYSTINWYPISRGINKSESTEAYEYADTLARILPPNSVVFTSSDYDIFPLWYIQTCEKRRLDLAVMGSNFVQNGWYAAQLHATLPAGIQAYITNEPPGKKERWLTAFLGGMAAPALQTGRPVYLTFFDPDISRYFSVEQHFQVPAPANPHVIQSFTRTDDTVISASSVKSSGFPPMPVYELADPVDYGRKAIQQFFEEFPPEERTLVHGEKQDK